MQTEPTNTAYNYALLIRGEILALETLLENWADIAGFTPDDISDDIDGDTFATIVDALAELCLDWPEDGGVDILTDYLNETCLDMTILRSEDNGRARVEILRTCGGPRCDITRDTNDGTVVEISVHDGGIHSVVRVNVDNVAAMLDELAGC